MSEKATPDKLLTEFEATSYEEWRKLAEDQLRGVPFEKKLVTKTYEGIDVQPIYNQADAADCPYGDSLPGFAPYLRGSGAMGRSWHIAQEIPYSTVEDFNAAIKKDLSRGQTAITLLLDKATLRGQDPDEAQLGAVGQDGVSIATLDDFSTALAGLNLEETPLFVQATSAAVPLMALLVASLKQQGFDVAKLTGGIEMDPLGTLVNEGRYPRSMAGGYDVMANLLKWAMKSVPNFKVITIHGMPYSNGGSNAVQELAFAIATGVEYLREMQARELAVDEVAPRMRFSLTVGSNYFMELAKLRAARLVWAKVVQAFGGNETAQKMTLHVRTSRWNKTVHDPYVNMLRTTTEAFAGAVAGCDSMHISQFDEPVRQPDEFSRRIARNTHIILQDESHLTGVIDPAGGSWYVERITDQLARKVWALFQQVEEQGGMLQALQAGFPQQQVLETNQQRMKNIATRKDVFIGINKYANLEEKPLPETNLDYEALQKRRAKAVSDHRTQLDGPQSTEVMAKLAAVADADDAAMLEAAVEAALAGATLGELAKTLRKGDESQAEVKLIPAQRGTILFEELRAVAASYLAKEGRRPQVFLANMGPIPQHKARADFATDFFQIGGFEVINNDGFETPEAAAQAALDSGAGVVVICSTDATYPELVPPLTEAIKKEQPEMKLVLAGYPKEHVNAFKQAGVDEFIHLRANAYQILTDLQAQL